MSAYAHPDQHKVKMTFECTADERAYIKMLAAKNHVNLSALLLSYLRADFPKYNRKTLESMQELDEGRGTVCTSLDDFWEQMGVTPSATA